MKLRNQLLAIFCLAIFIGLGVVYFRTWVAPKPFGVILFVSDGMVVRHLTVARMYEGGAGHRLPTDGFDTVAVLQNAASDSAVPDATAAATALATGQRVSRGRLSVDENGAAVQTLLELARDRGRLIGLVTDSKLTDPAVAAFYAHTAEPEKEANVAAQFVSAKIDVALGGGASAFQSKVAKVKEPSGDLLQRMQEDGREIVRTKAELEHASVYRERNIVGLFSEGELAHADQMESGSEQPSLGDMVRRAIQFLQTHGQGYLLVVDASLLTRAAERNEGERVIRETLALTEAIETAVRYAGERSLIIATGRHAVGGMSLNGFPLNDDRGIALVGVTPAGYPAITWASGPSGLQSAQDSQVTNEPAAVGWPAALPTAEDVLAIGRGPGSEPLRGFIDNTSLFDIIGRSL